MRSINFAVIVLSMALVVSSLILASRVEVVALPNGRGVSEGFAVVHGLSGNVTYCKSPEWSNGEKHTSSLKIWPSCRRITETEK